MKKRLVRIAMAVFAALLALVVLPTVALADTDSQPMYRLYNQWTGEHFYTSDLEERDGLVNGGWTYEAIGWFAPETSNTPVHRLYNKWVPGGDHHYTTSAKERDDLVAVGWTYEGIGWYSDDAKAVPLYRQYNPYAATGTHNYTTSIEENEMLIEAGWLPEGIGWYGVDEPADFEDTPVIITRFTVRNVPTSLVGGTGFKAEGTLVTGFGSKQLVSQAWYDTAAPDVISQFYSNPEDGGIDTLPEAGVALNYVIAVEMMPGCWTAQDVTVVINGTEYAGHFMFTGEFPGGQAAIIVTDYVVTTS